MWVTCKLVSNSKSVISEQLDNEFNHLIFHKNCKWIHFMQAGDIKWNRLLKTSVLIRTAWYQLVNCIRQHNTIAYRCIIILSINLFLIYAFKLYCNSISKGKSHLNKLKLSNWWFSVQILSCFNEAPKIKPNQGRSSQWLLFGWQNTTQTLIRIKCHVTNQSKAAYTRSQINFLSYLAIQCVENNIQILLL